MIPGSQAGCAFLLSYDGDVLDDADPDDIPRPFLRVKLRPGTSGWFAAGMHKFPVQFQVEMAVDGTRDSNLLKLWHHVRLALSPRLMAPGGNLTVLQVMMAGGMSTWKFSQAMYEIVDSGQGKLRYIYGLGYMEADLLINT